MPLVFTIRVVPLSGRCTCILDKNDTLKCFLKNPPEKGKANKELIKLIARALNVPQDRVQISAGQKARTKTITIETEHTYEHLLAALGIEQQTSLFD